MWGDPLRLYAYTCVLYKSNLRQLYSSTIYYMHARTYSSIACHTYVACSTCMSAKIPDILQCTIHVSRPVEKNRTHNKYIALEQKYVVPPLNSMECPVRLWW